MTTVNFQDKVNQARELIQEALGAYEELLSQNQIITAENYDINEKYTDLKNKHELLLRDAKISDQKLNSIKKMSKDEQIQDATVKEDFKKLKYQIKELKEEIEAKDQEFNNQQYEFEKNERINQNNLSKDEYYKKELSDLKRILAERNSEIKGLLNQDENNENIQFTDLENQNTNLKKDFTALQEAYSNINTQFKEHRQKYELIINELKAVKITSQNVKELEDDNQDDDLENEYAVKYDNLLQENNIIKEKLQAIVRASRDEHHYDLQINDEINNLTAEIINLEEEIQAKDQELNDQHNKQEISERTYQDQLQINKNHKAELTILKTILGEQKSELKQVRREMNRKIDIMNHLVNFGKIWSQTEAEPFAKVLDYLIRIDKQVTKTKKEIIKDTGLAGIVVQKALIQLSKVELINYNEDNSYAKFDF